MHRWIAHEGVPVSFTILPLGFKPAGLRVSTAGARRALRDIRDRTARRDGSWRSVALAGMAAGHGELAVLVWHEGISRAEVAEGLRRRWPGAILSDIGSLPLSWDFLIEDAVELARARRGVEPLRIVVLPERQCGSDVYCDTNSRLSAIEPMPVLL
jgi:hypothetical protein